jgi:hypothetical protein
LKSAVNGNMILQSSDVPSLRSEVRGPKSDA